MHPFAPTGSTSARPQPVIVVVIPARYAATRLPGKPLVDIGGQTMIERVYRQASLAQGIDRVVVATDDERILRAVEAFGGHAVMTRADHQSGTDRIAEVAQGLDCDILVNVQGDEPLLHPAMIEEVARPLADDSQVVMSTLGHTLDPDRDGPNPNVVKVVTDRLGFALYFTRAAVPYPRVLPIPTTGVYRHVGIYGYRRSFVLTLAALPRTPLECAESLEQLRALEHGYRIAVVETPYESLSVDTPDDLERVRARVTTAPQV